MSQPAIVVEGLSKAYCIGHKEEVPDSLVGAIQGIVRSPWKNFQRLRRLNTFGTNGHNADDMIWALKDVSFEVAEGEVVGIIGRNGAGKSTLLKILSRITEPTSGRALIHGRVSSLLEVGTGFHPELTGRENIYMNGTILGMTKREIDRKFDEIVDFSGVERFLDTPIKRYSSGMSVRLAFSVAAHLEPEILIIDEVLAVGDAEFQKKCLGKMHDVALGGRTVLFVSHNMAAVTNICERAVVVSHGQLTFNGQATDAVETYISSSSTATSTVPLSNHPNRRKGALPIFESITILDCTGKASSQLTSGESATFLLQLNRSHHHEYLEIGIVVYDSLGTRLFTIGTYLTASSSEIERGSLLHCQIDDLPLPPGTYTATMFAGPVHQLDIDTIEPAFSFDVVAGDFYGNGRLPMHARGAFLIRSQWKSTQVQSVLRELAK